MELNANARLHRFHWTPNDYHHFSSSSSREIARNARQRRISFQPGRWDRRTFAAILWSSPGVAAKQNNRKLNDHSREHRRWQWTGERRPFVWFLWIYWWWERDHDTTIIHWTHNVKIEIAALTPFMNKSNVFVHSVPVRACTCSRAHSRPLIRFNHLMRDIFVDNYHCGNAQFQLMKWLLLLLARRAIRMKSGFPSFSNL